MKRLHLSLDQIEGALLSADPGGRRGHAILSIPDDRGGIAGISRRGYNAISGVIHADHACDVE
jgi:hypothetical protein